MLLDLVTRTIISDAWLHPSNNYLRINFADRKSDASSDEVVGHMTGLTQMYLLRSILMSTWGFLPAVFRPLRTVFPGLGAGFLNLAGKTEGTAKKRGKTGEKWARNGLKRVG